MQIADAATPRDRLIEHGAALHLFDVLTKVADGQLLRNGNLALIRRFLTHHHAEERGFTGAVGTHQAYLFAGIQLEGCVYENELSAVLFIDVREVNHPEHPT